MGYAAGTPFLTPLRPRNGEALTSCIIHTDRSTAVSDTHPHSSAPGAYCWGSSGRRFKSCQPDQVGGGFGALAGFPVGTSLFVAGCWTALVR
ncbi:Uncharacterised protein [Mycobacteroides abscessus subsp. abscessus]|nr:Uncharacterised protein [Mycobacteroides abscessus subsp. abscessus]SKQ68445.1 Uncharacterised protein [Mycobacteroides abscessus subsp. abscessus]SKX40900.1 Uncharacterised protein [Mycobacteroides abscessus subsp. abscessus]